MANEILANARGRIAPGNSGIFGTPAHNRCCVVKHSLLPSVRPLKLGRLLVAFQA